LKWLNRRHRGNAGGLIERKDDAPVPDPESVVGASLEAFHVAFAGERLAVERVEKPVPHAGVALVKRVDDIGGRLGPDYAARHPGD
jgi:hypothetical protein